MTDKPSPIIITLDNGAHACGLSSSSRTGSVCNLSRQLIDAGHDPEAIVEVYRDGTLCFRPCKLKRWAEVTVSENDRRSASFIKWQPFQNTLRA